MKRLSQSQLAMLRQVRKDGNPLGHVHGQSAHGGASGTFSSLIRLKLIAPRWQGYALTIAGFEVLGIERKKRK